jgi:hypothetical protein
MSANDLALTQLDAVNWLLQGKFDDVNATHVDNIEGGGILLSDKEDGKRRARGPFSAVREITKEARDAKGLWDALEAAGLCVTARESQRTGATLT